VVAPSKEKGPWSARQNPDGDDLVSVPRLGRRSVGTTVFSEVPTLSSDTDGSSVPRLQASPRAKRLEAAGGGKPAKQESNARNGPVTSALPNDAAQYSTYEGASPSLESENDLQAPAQGVPMQRSMRSQPVSQSEPVHTQENTLASYMSGFLSSLSPSTRPDTGAEAASHARDGPVVEGSLSSSPPTKPSSSTQRSPQEMDDARPPTSSPAVPKKNIPSTSSSPQETTDSAVEAILPLSPVGFPKLKAYYLSESEKQQPLQQPATTPRTHSPQQKSPQGLWSMLAVFSPQEKTSTSSKTAPTRTQQARRPGAQSLLQESVPSSTHGMMAPIPPYGSEKYVSRQQIAPHIEQTQSVAQTSSTQEMPHRPSDKIPSRKPNDGFHSMLQIPLENDASKPPTGTASPEAPPRRSREPSSLATSDLAQYASASLQSPPLPSAGKGLSPRDVPSLPYQPAPYAQPHTSASQAKISPRSLSTASSPRHSDVSPVRPQSEIEKFEQLVQATKTAEVLKAKYVREAVIKQEVTLQNSLRKASSGMMSVRRASEYVNYLDRDRLSRGDIKSALKTLDPIDKAKIDRRVQGDLEEHQRRVRFGDFY
jgi:hypothetical protein